MTPINLTKIVSKYKSGWIAINKTNKNIIAHSRDFASLVKKVEKEKDVVLMPAAKDFSGIVTFFYE